jgi:hypothetical protein
VLATALALLALTPAAGAIVVPQGGYRSSYSSCSK